MKTPIVYIMTNTKNGTLYTGVTLDLLKRVYEHKTGIMKGFIHKYACKNLVFYELHDTMEAAIAREKQIKAGSRKKEIELIKTMNPDWKDLYTSLT